MPQSIGRAMTTSVPRISDDAPSLAMLVSTSSLTAHTVDLIDQTVRAVAPGSGDWIAEACDRHRSSQRLVAELAWDDDDDEDDDFLDDEDDDDEDIDDDDDDDDDDDFDDPDEDEDDEDEDDDDYFDDEDEDDDDEELDEDDLEDGLDEDEEELVDAVFA